MCVRFSILRGLEIKKQPVVGPEMVLECFVVEFAQRSLFVKMKRRRQTESSACSIQHGMGTDVKPTSLTSQAGSSPKSSPWCLPEQSAVASAAKAPVGTQPASDIAGRCECWPSVPGSQSPNPRSR